MKMYFLRALLVLGWLGMTDAGGWALRAQKVVYNQYFYFNSFETEADLEGWQAQRPYGSYDAFDGRGSISQTDGNNGFILTPEFDVSTLEEPVLSFTATCNSDMAYPSKIYISEDNGRYKEIPYKQGAKVSGSVYHYLIPLPKSVCRIKFQSIDKMDAFCIYDKKQEIPLTDQAFYCDFDGESDLEGWSTDGSRSDKYNVSGDFYIRNFSTVVTPELDLSTMRNPLVSCSFEISSSDTLQMLVSVDGASYDTLMKATYGDGSRVQYLLPWNTKRIKFEMLNRKEYYDNSFYSICIREAYLVPWLDEPGPMLVSWLIPEDKGGLQWEHHPDSLVLKGTASAGTSARLILPKPASYYMQYAFTFRNPDPQKVKVEYNRKEITGASGELILEACSDYGYLAFTSVDGSPVNISVADFRILKEISSSSDATYPYHPEYWYDDIPGNGIMEFAGGVNYGVSWNDGYLYEVKQNGVYAYHRVENFLSFQNLNNDSIVDFIAEKNSISNSVSNYIIVRSVDGSVYEKKNLGWDVLVADLNSDGQPDIVPNDENGRTYLQLPDGTFEEHLMKIQSYEAYKNGGKNEEWSGGTGGFIVSDGIPGIRDDMFARDGVGGNGAFGALGSMLTDLDFNHDGRMDLLNEHTGQLLINLGDDNYVAIQLDGQIYFRDLNGDGRLDYVVYNDKTKTVKAVIDNNGTVTEQVLMTNLSMDATVWCYDFDKDGDIDILLPFSYQTANGASFLVMMENDGKGHFTQHENYFEEHYLFKACADVDHDGQMDIVAQFGEKSYDDYSHSWVEQFTVPYQVVLLKGMPDLTFKPQAPPLLTFDEAKKIMVADINQDGVYEIVERKDGNGNSADKINYLSGISANTAPSRPATPAFVYEPATGYLKVSWQLGEDAESASMDLTYALRIGTAPGKGDRLYAHAYSDGKRRNLLDGNMGYNLDKVLNVASWPEGTYYIAVQAIDPVHNGSAWSEEAVFEKTGLSAVFIISTPKSTVDTMIVSYGGSVQKTYTYDWNFDGAEIVRANADSSVFVLRWATPGEKTISLQVTDGKGNSSSLESKTFDIFANEFVNAGITFDPALPIVYAFIDLDGNGVMDALTDNGVYENDGTAYFTKVKKIYNTNLKFSSPYLLDISGDGNAEIVEFGSDQTIVYKNMGNMTLGSPEQIKGTNYGGDFVDIDNDGKEDLYNYSSVYKNTGDYVNWDKVLDFSMGIGNTGGSMVDFNHDGYPDFITDQVGTIGDWTNAPILYENQGKGTFKKIILNNPLGGGNFKISAITDVNSDGYPDLILIKNALTLVVCLNNQNKDFNQTFEINLPIKGKNDIELNCIKDFDNNGYPDLMIEMNYDDHGMIYFYPNGLWKFWHYNLYSSGFVESYYNASLADLNGDGTLDNYGNDFNNGFSGFLNQTQVTNTPPEAPAHIRAVQTDTTVLIEWDAAKDAESLPAQMRYNVSVKKKGAKGDGAFIISPLNGLNDQAAIIPSHYYRTATRMEIPLAAMPVADYEIQIQAFDGWDAHSSFSPVYDFSVQKAVSVKMPAVACINTEVTVRYTGTEDFSALQWDWDGGRLTGQENGNYTVSWDTEGTKKVTVTVGGVASSASILVKTAPELNFDINPYALENSLTPLTLPELALDPSYVLTWQVAKDGSDYATPEMWRDTLSIARRGITREVQVCFMKEGNYTLRLQTDSENCGIVEASRQVEVKGDLPVPQIGLVTVDAATAKNRLRWGVPADLPEYVQSVNIYKESSKYNDFRLLANVPLTQTEYVDMTSSPEITSSRYRLTLVTNWGAEGEPGVVHRSVHVMINKGMGNSWNLIWTPYEGAIVESFRILRGTSADALEVIGEVAGSAMSWSDMTAPEGTLYYALEFDSEYDDTWRPMLRSARSATRASVRSNVVGVVDAADVLLAESLQIRCLEDKVVLNPEQKTLHLYVDIQPLTATYRRVNWQIIEGQDLTTVDVQGIVTVKGNAGGKVKVCALTVDGSEVSDTLEIMAEHWELEVVEVAVTDVVGCADSDNGELLITGKGGDGVLSYSINGGKDWCATNRFTGLKGGDYVVVIRDETDTEARWTNDPVYVGAPDPVVIDTVVLVPVDGAPDGKTRIEITARGGSGYQKYYNYDGTDNWIQSASGTYYPGSYNIRVKDENGCVAGYRHNPVVIFAPGQLGITGVVIQDVSVGGGSDGEIHITAQGGQGVLSYSVNGGIDYFTSPDFSGLSAGNYIVFVKDEAGMTVEYAGNPVVIHEPEVTFAITEVMCRDVQGCYGERTGEIRITATAPAGPLYYALNGVWQDSSHFTGLAAGSYQVMVRDGNENEAIYSGNPVVISQPEELKMGVDSTFISELRGQNVTVSASGGSQPYLYSADGGTNWQEMTVFEGLLAGTYDVRVRDGYGCETGKIFVLRTPVWQPLNIVDVEVSPVSVYDGADGTLTIRVTGGIDPVNYSIDGGVNYASSSVFTDLKAGEYHIMVRDAAGREFDYGRVIVSQPDKPEEPAYTLQIEDFRLRDGAEVTASRKITLEQHVTGGVPLFYQVCEDTLTVSDSWNTYRLTPVYELSVGEGMKTVYMRVKGEYGLSRWVKASIRYEEAVGLKIEQALVNDGNEYVTDTHLRLTLLVSGEPQEMQVILNDWNSGWVNYQEFSEYQLSAGEGDYVCRVKVRNTQFESEEVRINFVYKKAPRKLNVEDFVLQGGSPYTYSRTVTLDHWIDGGVPVVYTVSESADLHHADWFRYKELPQYTLSGGTGMKTVYFAVASGRDTSETVSARILLEEDREAGLNVKIWPNPVKDVLHVMLMEEEAAEETRVTVYTVMGQMVEHRICQGREISLDVSHYPFGVLFVEFVNDGRKVVKQILKK